MSPLPRKPGSPVRWNTTWTLPGLILVWLLAAYGTTGMGLIPTGGAPVVGISANELTSSVSRPLSPLNSLLMDESYQGVIPLGDGIALATFEEMESDTIRMTLSSNIVLGDTYTRVLTPEDVISSWEARTHERWDARWALRGVSGIENLSGYINGLVPVDNRTLEITLRPGVEIDDFRNSLASPALRLAVPSSGQFPDGTGPFLPTQPSPVRTFLTGALAHFAGRPYLNEVSIIAYPSADESVLDFGRGSLDALMITSNEKHRYEESSRAMPGRLETVGQAIAVIVFNPARLPDPDERRALALAVDRDSIARVVLGEGAVVAGDFTGSPAEPADWPAILDEARQLYTNLEQPAESLALLVSDGPAARAAAGRLRANWESLGVPVDIQYGRGPLALSMEADAVLLSMRIPQHGEGVLPQCLALYDRSGWWEFIALALPDESARLLRTVRSLEPNADINELGSTLESAGLVIPVTRYDILFAPGPDISLVPSAVYPGTALWRAFMGGIEESAP